MRPVAPLRTQNKGNSISVDTCASGVKANIHNPRINQISTTHRFNPPPSKLLMVLLLVSLETEILNAKTQSQWHKEQKKLMETTSSVRVTLS